MIGKGVPHESALRHVSGEAIYVDDIPEHAGTLVGLVLPSPHAHARIVGIDTSGAVKVPGVHAVLTSRDIPGENNVGPIVHDEPMLAEGVVNCVGQPVAVVIADDYEAARAAVAAIAVDYEQLPAILSIDAAIEAGSFHGEDHVIERGDVDGAMASAPHVLRGTVRNGGQDHFYLESQVAVAVLDEDRTIRVFSSTQHPSEVQALVAETLGWGRHRVTVVCPRMGGAFGGKETQAAQFACMAALGATVTGRPVKVWLDRDTDMTLTGRRHPFQTHYTVGFDADGRILSLEMDMVADGGWATDLSLSILDRGLFHADNGYWLPVVKLRGRVAKTHVISNTAFRGFGGPQGMVVIERVMEDVAASLGRDPLQVRRINFYTDTGRHTPYGQEVDDFRLPRILDELEASASLTERRAAVEAFNASHRWHKRGLALTPVKFGISFTASFLNQAGAYIVLYADGTVQLNHGGTEMGQGLYTKMIQVCAHTLGVPPARVRAMATATDKVPNTSATAASSGADLNGAAVKLACAELLERLRPIAEELLGGPVTTAADHVDGPEGAWAWREGASATLSEVARAAYVRQTHLAAAGFYATPDIHYDRKAGHGKPFHYFAYGAAVSEVEVNGLTGEWRLHRVDILHDVGDSLSSDIDRGQVEGGFAQGLGWLTMEELVFDDRGFLLTHSPSTYKIPAVGDIPPTEDFRVALLERAPQPGVVYGSKAVGEPPFMLAISTYVALCRAASAFGAPVAVDIPATTEAILFAVEDARAGAEELRQAGK